MRPLNLVMSAFGPFADVVTIDFRKLGTRGLYLVTGETGAGKTTIFDAITFALYGTASGEYRDNKMFRSKYAGADVRTYVELTFESQGKIYVVNRVPEYTRVKLHGEGTTPQRAEATLLYPDERGMVTKVKEVDQAVKEIVGLDRKQFSQITMLAQGEFRKMLLSNTDEKQKIFRDIFMTEPYGKLQDHLKREYQHCKTNYEDRKKDILKNIELLECSQENALKEQLDAYQKNQQLVQQDAFDEWMKEILDSDKETLKVADQELAIMNKSAQELDEQIGRASERRHAKEELQQIEEKMIQLQSEQTAASKRLEETQKAALVCETLSEDVVRITQKLNEYQAYTDKKREIEQKKKNLEVQENEQTKRKSILMEYDKEISIRKECLENNKDAHKNEMLAEQEWNAKQSDKTLVEDLQKKYEQIIGFKSEATKAKENYIEVREIYTGLAQAYREREEGFYDAQAGILAEKLEDGKPCPVCGALEHPHPAKPSAQVATREQLKREKEALEEVEKKRENASAKAHSAEEQWKQALSQWEEQVKKLFPDSTEYPEELQKKYNLLKLQIADIEKRVKCWKQAHTEYEKAYNEIPAFEEKRNDLEVVFQKVEKDSITKRSEIHYMSEQLETLKKGLQYDSEDAARAEVDKLKKEIETRKNEQTKALDNLQRIEKEIKMSEGRKTSLLDMINRQPVQDIEVLEEQRKKLVIEKSQRQTFKEAVMVRYSKNQELVKKIREGWSKFFDLEQEYIMWKALSDTANGELAGRDKIKLETYIQMAYFEQVLAKANVRLLGMTGGQYELVRSDQSSDQRSRSGLELNVYDYYTASERSVKSLSGGETFMASLALALGLADEIQESAGGVQIDTLFVDEGFGSLDDETLRSAMIELDKLTEGNRLVGIISHVSDLKNWVDRQVIVRKNRQQGSLIELQIG